MSNIKYGCLKDRFEIGFGADNTHVRGFNQSFVFLKESHTWDNSNLRTWTTSPHPQTLPLLIDLNLLLPYKMDILPYIWQDGISSYLRIVNYFFILYART